MLSATPVLFALLGSNAAHAQAAPLPTTAASDAASVEGVVITGTRVVRNGYAAPTPVSVLSADEVQKTATPNIADYVNTLPSLSGSSTPATTSNSVFNNGQGINGLNLRGLGVVRTLVLLNGQRVVPALNTGVVDISEFPQQLISRIDVVTGGASAAYGSDALTGVVNFILDTKFTGVKGEVSTGITDYGDDSSTKVDLTAGKAFAQGRGHFIVSGEISNEHGKFINNRPWNSQPGLGWMSNPNYTPTNGQPQQLLLPQVGLSSATFGGQIACSATSACASLRGIAFGPGGVPYNTAFGSVVNDPFMSGGSWQGDAYVRDKRAQSLAPPQKRQNLYTRLSYEVAPNWNVYGEASYSHLISRSMLVPVFFPGNLTIKSDNAFIPSSIASRASALGIPSFPFGTMNGDLPSTNYYADRRQQRFVVGADGQANVFGNPWKITGYLEAGLSKAHTENRNTISVPNYMLAIDAVRAPSGAIVCRSTLTAPGNGCVPYNVFGTGVNNQAAINYVTGGTPFQSSTFIENVAAVDASGDLFNDWAGPVSLAVGAGYRQEKSRGISDPFENPPVPWFFSTGLPTIGQYSVTEAYAETVVPLARDTAWAKNLDVNGSVRATHYRTGTVATWKLGATYTPVEDLRFRATHSRDIREPTLDDLFRGTFTTTTSVNDPFNNNTGTPTRTTAAGNPNLTPEIAYTTGVGAVLQPRFIPGFNASVDYYDIKISNAIATLTAQQVLNLCFGGNQAFCNLVTRGVGQYTIAQGPFNIATEHDRGIDFEASYRFDLEKLTGLPGRIDVRGLATRFLNDTVNPGIPGSIVVENVGANASSGPPKWRYQASVGYTSDRLSMSLTARGVSAGVYSNTNIECTSGCPASTANNLTVNNNHIDGALYFDLAASYRITPGIEAFANVRNLANKDPAPFAQQTTVGYVFENANPALYDILGRVYRVGVRFKM